MFKKILSLSLFLLLLFPQTIFAETISLSMKYTPSPAAGAVANSNISIGIAKITDKRDREEKNFVGKRISYTGSKDFFAPAGVSVEDAVTDMIGEYFKKKGFKWKKVERWNLDAPNLNAEWGDIVIGGEIVELWSDVISKFMSNEHKVKARLKIVIADPKEKRILWTDTATTSLDMKEPLFHEESVEKMINEAASSCIENIFEDRAFKEILNTKY
ncbi:MAG: hypothetical protein HZA05_05490 [Nitrospirae bacterium]|nr:hypothetical protein [Nitrospirota bacterium]